MTSISSSGATVPNRSTTATRRVGTETKSAFKTTEFLTYVAAVVGVLVASLLVDSEGPAGDVFQADRAWMLVTALTIGYMISRGLAKSGSREFRNEND
jgi:hypothetical protein